MALVETKEDLPQGTSFLPQGLDTYVYIYLILILFGIVKLLV
jgi:hypothetical protein